MVIEISVVKNVCVANIELICFLLAQHVLVPHDSLLQFIRVRLTYLAVAKGKRIEHIALELTGYALLIIPFVGPPFKIVSLNVEISEAFYLKVNRVTILDSFFEDSNCLHILSFFEVYSTRHFYFRRFRLDE
jgi:hypothetical protein